MKKLYRTLNKDIYSSRVLHLAISPLQAIEREQSEKQIVKKLAC